MEIINFPTAITLFLKRWELSWRFKFAHHPICPSYNKHYWNIKGVYLCQGCSIVYTCFFSALLFLILFHITFIPVHYLFVGLGILIPILLVEIIKIEQRSIKRLARAGIGIGLSLPFSAFVLHEEIVVKVMGLLITLLGFISFRQVRKAANREDLCKSCPEYKSNRICNGLRLEAEAMRKYSDYASDLLHAELKEKYRRKLN